MIARVLAAVEQHRAEGMTARAAEIAATPDHPQTGSLSLYRQCARATFEAAAALTKQPGTGRRS